MAVVGRAAVAIMLLGMTGCAYVPIQTFDPYPVYGNPVNPTPARGYRLECTSGPGVTNFAFDDYYSQCSQVIAPAEVAIETRG